MLKFREFVAVSVSAFFVVLRFWNASKFFYPGAGAMMVFGLSELLAAGATCYSLRRGMVDCSLPGLFIPVLYMIPSMLSPWGCGPGLRAAAVVCVALCLVQLGLRAWLGWRCTVGVPCFTGVTASGPYSLIRHPLALTEILIVMAFLVALPSGWNLCVAGASVVGSLVVVYFEESFLSQFPTYREYCGRVRSRLVPGVL